MTEERTIKKYPNRRLYDMAISSYITLQDVRNLVVGGSSIKVIDAKTQSDLSAPTLLQIICEQEQKNKALFATGLLEKLIRLYNQPNAEYFNEFLSQTVDYFLNKSNGQDVNGNAADIAQRNQALWQDVLDGVKHGKTTAKTSESETV